MNGYEHDRCVLAKCRELGCDFVDLQETKREGKTYSFAVLFVAEWIQGSMTDRDNM